MKTTSLKTKASRLIFSGLMLGLALSGCSKSEMVEKKQDQILPDYQVTETADSYIIKEAAVGNVSSASFEIPKKQDPYPAEYWKAKSQLKSNKIVEQVNANSHNSVVSTCINTYSTLQGEVNNLKSKRTYSPAGVYLGGVNYTYNTGSSVVECTSIVTYDANSKMTSTVTFSFNSIGTHALERVSRYDGNKKLIASYRIENIGAGTDRYIDIVHQYDAAGSLIQNAYYTYDKKMRVTKITFDGGGAASRVFTYDSSGQLIKSVRGAYGNTTSVEYKRLPEWNEMFEYRYTNKNLSDYTHYYFDNTTGNYDPSDPKNTINFLATQ